MSPAVDKYGTKEWVNDQGVWHRLDGPAVEHPKGTKEWYKNGLCHRLDGPAIEYPNGDKSWYIDGVKYTHDQLLEYLLS